jgi:Fe-S-cluster-containing hydrogenase component 2
MPTEPISRNQHARRLAQTAVEKIRIEPTGLVRYSSRGRVLVVGAEEAQWLAARLQAPLHAEVLLTAGDDEPGVPSTALAGREVSIDGHLGAFRVELGKPGKHNHQVLQADMIVDLCAQPFIACELPPPGYWHLATEPQDLDAAVVELDGMIGTFEKPRYFDYGASICAHARSGQAGCSKCIEACPAEAIISIGEAVEVNPNLCQGGGACASACPTGAMRYAYPGPGDTAQRVREMLRTYRDAGGTDAVVMFAADSDVVELTELPPNVLLTAVEELASTGHELWLAALAWGAERVLLADGGSVPASSRRVLQQQLEICQVFLHAHGLPPDGIRMLGLDAAAAACTPAVQLQRGASFAADTGKRQMAALAMDHFREASEVLPSQAIELPEGSPYGKITVDAERCTLCLGCTSVCPSHALNAGEGVPQLVFHESKCVQCGICRNACPEQAISLSARWLPDPEQRRLPRVLHEEPPFCCVSCGKPFATRRVIDTILDKLDGHAMFQTDRARRRLQMCEDCRVIDAVQDEDAMQAAGFDPTGSAARRNN